MKQLCFCIAVLLSACLFSVSARAGEPEAFHPVLTAAQGREGDVVDLVLSYDGTLGQVGAFLVRVEYDVDRFEYLRVRQSAAMQEGIATTVDSGGKVSSVYTQRSRETCLSSPEDPYVYRFRLREGAEAGKCGFFVTVTQIVSPQPEFLGHDTDAVLDYRVLPPPSSDAYLFSLSPETGTLSPEFSPDRLGYRMSVPFEVKTMSFFADPAPGADCRVNRKNLGAGGSDTEFLFTVTAEDGESKRQYRVVVRREPKAAAAVTEKPIQSPRPSPTPKPEKTPGPTKTPKPTASSKADKAESASPKGDTVSSSLEKLTVSPAPAGESSRSPAIAPVSRGGTPTGLTILNGGISPLPLALILIFFNFALLCSKPLAQWICRRFGEHKGEGENHDPEEK